MLPDLDPPHPFSAQVSLQRERERVASIVASVPGVVWEIWGKPDPASQRINFVSDYVTTLLGYSVEEWLATSNFWLKIVHPEDRERAAAEALATYSSCSPTGTSRFRWIGRDGSALWVETRSSTICDSDGSPVGMRGVTFDVSRQVAAEKRYTVQAEASAALASSLDVVQTLRTVSLLLVPAIADLCVIHLLQPDGRLVAMDTSDAPADSGGAFPVDPLAFNAYRRALEGEAVFIANVSHDHLGETTLDAEQRESIRALGVQSGLVVPLATRYGPVGTLTLATCRPDRRLGRDDLLLAVELGRRCGVAVENAQLLVTARAELDQRRIAEASLERKARQQEVLAELGRIALGSATARTVAQIATERVREVCEFDTVHVIDLRSAGLAVSSSASSARANPSGMVEADVLTLASRVITDGLPVSTENLCGVLITIPPRRFGALVARGGTRSHDEGRFLELVANILANSSERERAEIALQQEKEHLAVTLRSIGDGVIATDIDARVVLVNAVAEQLTGWSQSEAMGRAVTDVFPIVNPRTRVPVSSPVLDVLRAGGLGGPSNQTALLARDEPERERVVAHSAAPIRDHGGNIVGAVLVFRDVTDKERMDAELQRASMLESLGVLAGGIAHDFNNILTSVLANVSLAGTFLPDGHPANARIAQAERAVVRARDLTQQLLTFARGGAPVRTPTSIAEVVRESAGFVLSGSAFRACYTIDPHPWVVDADAGQISQVVQNLVLNATQAMPIGMVDGGSIDIRVRNVRLHEPTGLPLPAGDYVRVEVTDHGKGIDPAHLPHIFDPFYTTKSNGRGLGLASAYAIVNKHDGHIAVTSEPGLGTRFSVYLPIARTGSWEASPAPLALVRGAGRVLVMDDDTAVRSTIAELLGALGYAVDLTADGAEAIEAWQRARRVGTPYTCALLDLTVPGGMGGLRTLRTLHALDPSARAIVSSGYSEDPVMANFASHGFVDVLRKPYTMREVSAVLARVAQIQ